MKTKSELIKKVSKLHKKVAKLQSKIDAMPDKVVSKTGVIYEAPKDGTEVWALNNVGEVYQIVNYSRNWYPELTQGLLFHDEESAILAGKVRAIRHKLAGFCTKAWDDAGKVVDWGNRQQGKHSLFYGHQENRVLLGISFCINKGIYHLPSHDLTELRASFTQDELKLALTGEL